MIVLACTLGVADRQARHLRIFLQLRLRGALIEASLVERGVACTRSSPAAALIPASGLPLPGFVATETGFHQCDSD